MAVLHSIGLNVTDIGQAAQFYQHGLGFVPQGPIETATLPFAPDMKIWRQVLRLGDQTLELTQFDDPGRPLPPDSTSSDLWFQHIAIVVADMNAAFARLQTCHVTPISQGGPQILPPEAGRVQAYKFRDPDGHPLELLQFPAQSLPAYWREKHSADLYLGYDHSAISVADIDRSIAYYQATLGFGCVARQTNSGPAQARLDDAVQVAVDVVALQSPDTKTPHIELLGYRHPRPRSSPYVAKINDIGATRLIFNGIDVVSRLERDPDGHVLVIGDDS